MKKLILLMSIFMLTYGVANAQAKNAVSNHAFIMCDENETPTTSYGQAFYIVLYNNGEVKMLCGKDLSTAIKNGPTKSGTWSASGSKVWWTWSDGKTTPKWTLNSYTNNLESESVIMKDMGGF
jgi:hypothetical protein